MAEKSRSQWTPRTRMLVVSVQESLLEKVYSETCCILQGEIRPSVGGAEERSRNWSRPAGRSLPPGPVTLALISPPSPVSLHSLGERSLGPAWCSELLSLGLPSVCEEATLSTSGGILTSTWDKAKRKGRCWLLIGQRPCPQTPLLFSRELHGQPISRESGKLTDTTDLGSPSVAPSLQHPLLCVYLETGTQPPWISY